MRTLTYISHSDRHYIWTAKPIGRNTAPVQQANMNGMSGKMDVYGNYTKKEERAALGRHATKDGQYKWYRTTFTTHTITHSNMHQSALVIQITHLVTLLSDIVHLQAQYLPKLYRIPLTFLGL